MKVETEMKFPCLPLIPSDSSRIIWGGEGRAWKIKLKEEHVRKGEEERQQKRGVTLKSLMLDFSEKVCFTPSVNMQSHQLGSFINTSNFVKTKVIRTTKLFLSVGCMCPAPCIEL